MKKVNNEVVFCAPNLVRHLDEHGEYSYIKWAVYAIQNDVEFRFPNRNLFGMAYMDLVIKLNRNFKI